VPHQDTIALKPSTLTHVEAASLPIVAVTSIQAFDQAVARMGSLKGKTLFIPAALSGTGSIAIQLAKSVYGASKVITTASTSKIPKLTERLGHGMVDQVIDYTMQDPLKEITHGSVDLMIDTIGGSLSFLPLLKPKAGLIISFSTIPSGTAALQHFPQLPFYIRYLMDLGHWYYKWRVGRWKVEFNTTLGDINFEDLDRLRIWFDEGAKVKPVVGRTVRLDDLEGVRAGCNEVYKGHGGIGKFVIEI
jgi:NADPH:quinone reductase-like Zn-dependent oxidoreductase